jgi:hypothetical protein
VSNYNSPETFNLPLPSSARPAIQPSPADLKDLHKQNQICKVEGELDRVVFTLSEVEKDIKRQEESAQVLVRLSDYLMRYKTALEEEETLPWFPIMEMLLRLLRAAKDLPDAPKLREAWEAVSIGAFVDQMDESVK